MVLSYRLINYSSRLPNEAWQPRDVTKTPFSDTCHWATYVLSLTGRYCYALETSCMDRRITQHTRLAKSGVSVDQTLDEDKALDSSGHISRSFLLKDPRHTKLNPLSLTRHSCLRLRHRKRNCAKTNLDKSASPKEDPTDSIRELSGFLGLKDPAAEPTPITPDNFTRDRLRSSSRYISARPWRWSLEYKDWDGDGDGKATTKAFTSLRHGSVGIRPGETIGLEAQVEHINWDRSGKVLPLCRQESALQSEHAVWHVDPRQVLEGNCPVPRTIHWLQRQPRSSRVGEI